MDAVRLIAAGRHALAQSGAAWDIVGEAWQAQALAQGIGSWLAVTGPPELKRRHGDWGSGRQRLRGHRPGGAAR